MTYEVNGRTLEATDSGYLVNQDDWDKDVAQAMPSPFRAKITLTGLSEFLGPLLGSPLWQSTNCNSAIGLMRLFQRYGGR